MNPITQFQSDCEKEIAIQGADKAAVESSAQWMEKMNSLKYSYHFTSLGRPIIQFPQDMVAMQELIWKCRPDLIIETGVAHGGSLILSASMLAMLDYCDALADGTTLDPSKPKRKVVGIDIDIREHNRKEIEAHPMANRIEMVQGSSIDPALIAQIHERAKGVERVMVCLDSNHTHEHVLAELEAYAPLATVDNYCVVFDTVIEDMAEDFFPDRPWGKGDNPKTAVWEYLKSHPEFVIDKEIDHKLMVTVAPDGFLKRIS